MVNKIILVGNLGRDPEVRTLENGTKVGSFTLATNESYKDKSDNWQTLTEWHNIVVWRYLAEKSERELKKGSLAYIEGKMTHRKYTDKDGVERSISEIVASNVYSLERKESGNRLTNAPLPGMDDEPFQGLKNTESSSSDSFAKDSDLPF